MGNSYTMQFLIARVLLIPITAMVTTSLVYSLPAKANAIAKLFVKQAK